MLRSIFVFIGVAICSPLTHAQICTSQDAVVYFVTDETELTSQAQEVVKYMAQRIPKACKVDEVFLSGHTDSNEALAGLTAATRLSNQRVISVAETMSAQGIDPNVIVTANFRDRRPARQTPPGSKEPLNRRVEIEIKVSPAS